MVYGGENVHLQMAQMAMPPHPPPPGPQPLPQLVPSQPSNMLNASIPLAYTTTPPPSASTSASTNYFVVNIDGPINFNATHSLQDDGADLPFADINTMRFFYNLGIEVNLYIYIFSFT